MSAGTPKAMTRSIRINFVRVVSTISSIIRVSPFLFFFYVNDAIKEAPAGFSGTNYNEYFPGVVERSSEDHQRYGGMGGCCTKCVRLVLHVY